MYWRKQELAECFICCSYDGKTDAEKLFEMQFNQKYMNYPLISLAQSYKCNCATIHAHNKCLLFIGRCPSCRKICTPDLYVETKYDYYLARLFRYLKHDTRRIYQMYKMVMINLLVLMATLALLEYIKEVIPKKSTISLCITVVIGCSFGVSTYVLVVLDDYFKKYWLYDSKTERCYVFYEHIH
jgi:hypothetical protein